MSPTIGLPPPPAERCLETSRKSRYRGGTLVAEDVHDLGEHERRLADPDLYRPVPCERCGAAAVHVHTRPERRPRGEPSLPPAVAILQFRCAACGATWRILPLFLARHLWHAWKAVERAVAPSAELATSSAPPIRARTSQRWSSRLASAARALVVALAASGGAALEEVAKRVGLLSTRAELVDAHAAMAVPAPGERLASLGALLHRIERGLRLM
jgi:hypothetical protein